MLSFRTYMSISRETIGQIHHNQIRIDSFQLQTPFNNLLMNVVFMEVFSTFWGIPVDFGSSITHGKLMRNGTICLTTGIGLACSGELNYIRGLYQKN
jgi:hypothetical protein